MTTAPHTRTLSPWRLLALVGRWLAVLLACYVGGVAATNLSPTVVETAHYRAVLRLDPVPSHTPSLHSPTIAGDVDLQFTSPVLAPGLDVAVSVREEITGLLTGPGVSVATLQPSSAEVSEAVRGAATGVGLRFAIGALVVAAALSLSVHYARRRRPERTHLALVASALVATCAVTGVSTALTYQPGRFLRYDTTGLLSAVQRNAGMLQGVEARAAQVAPYLRNLLAVSQALQAKFVPSELGGTVGARILLVSDIHGANQYRLMKSIIDEEQIDAVIDSGDLLNFGRVQEGEAAGIFASIAALGVPYVFTSGNHDQSSPTDRAVLARMAQVPNVVLLQKPDGSHQELSFHGLRITGFNDPRYFGDDNADPVAKEAPAVDAYNAVMAGQPVSDVVVTHEPYAVRHVGAGSVLVNGHIHTPALDGNRIQVGTFTGGGVVAHFSEGQDSELTGQPYAFDIATFGSTCGLTQLARYTFRNLLEGRPAYDNVQVINGQTVDARGAIRRPAADAGSAGVTRPAAEQRTCSRLEETTVRPLLAGRTGAEGSATPTGTTVSVPPDTELPTTLPTTLATPTTTAPVAPTTTP